MRIQRFKKHGRTPRATPSFPKVEVHKGNPKDEKGRVGNDRPDFRLVWPEGYEHVQAAFEARWGKNPKRFENIMLMSDDPEEACSTAMEKWVTGPSGKAVLIRRCTGVEIVFLRTEHGVQRNTGEACLDDCDCVSKGRITWVMPELVALSGELVLFTLVTGAKSDIENFLATIDFAMAGSEGNLRRVVFNLWREPVDTITPDGISVQKHQVKLGLARASIQRVAAGYAGNVLQLVAGVSQQDAPDEYLAIPENTTSATKKTTPATGLKKIKLQPVVRIWMTGKFTTYAFKSVKGNVTVYTQDTALVRAVIPNIMSLEPDKTHPIDARGFEAVYSAELEKEGRDIFISELTVL